MALSQMVIILLCGLVPVAETTGCQETGIFACPTGQICQAGTCAQHCTTGTCPIGEICNLVTGTCTAVSGAEAQKEEDDWLASFQEQQAASSTRYLINWIIDFVVSAIFAFLYKSSVVDKLPELQRGNGGYELGDRVGLFACFGDFHTCLYTFCCPFSVAAKNFEKAGVVGFWPAWLSLYVTTSCCCCIGVILRTFWTGQFKDHLGIRHNMVSDCCLGCWCFPCEIGREGMLVDEELGVDIKCVLKIESHDGSFSE